MKTPLPGVATRLACPLVSLRKTLEPCPLPPYSILSPNLPGRPLK